MAKSRDTFGKKENDKKRIAKKKEKEERKKDRQANNDKGKSLEDMFAYVDENGNLTSSPPDASKRREVNVEDIEIGVRKQGDEEPEAAKTGVVTMYNSSKGFGFIKDSRTGESIFVHASAVAEELREQDKVTFETERTPKGMSAVNVTKIK